MRAVTVIAFGGALILSVQKNENGNWTLSPRTTLAQGGSESGGGSENGGCESCVENMMLKYKTCVKYCAMYNSTGKKIAGGMVSGSRMPCVEQDGAFCNQLSQKPCDAEIPAGAVELSLK